MSALLDSQTPFRKPSPQPSFHFMLLPFEIRIMIYKYAAYNYTTEVGFCGPTRGYIYDKQDFTAPLALLQTCRQISEEASPIFFADVDLCFFQDCGSVLVVRSCGPIVPSAIRRLRLDLDVASCDPALYLLQWVVGQPEGLRVVHISWTDRHIPTIRNDAFDTPLIGFLQQLEGLEVLMLSGDYGNDFLQCAQRSLRAKVVAG
ncbi:hypothetical protein F5Y10DRAFT_290404 [Nemania abortiva]|nr:hypothetical protein F5Y10DRAFT_290404 [Nemania abortiva]